MFMMKGNSLKGNCGGRKFRFEDILEQRLPIETINAIFLFSFDSKYIRCII